MPSATPETVTAPLSYYSPPTDGSAPYNRVNSPDWPASDPTAQLPLSNWSPVKHSVLIENVRGKEGAYLLDEAGFQFYSNSPATHKAFVDEEEIKREYYPESAELIKKLTGASRIVLFDHTIRRRIPGQIDVVSKRQPVQEVHIDQTLASATARVNLHLPPDLAPTLLQHRFQIINLWRPIGHAAFDMPLTLCDYRSVDERDLVAVARLAPDRKGETYRVKWNAEHRWKYLKGMTPDEFVLIKCFDSKEGVSVFTPHTAFQDPSMPEGSLPRESIELRALVFYD